MTDRDNPPLKPCPFCGGRAAPMRIGGGTVRVECIAWQCRVLGPTRRDDEHAVAAWNTRKKEKPDAE